MAVRTIARLTSQGIEDGQLDKAADLDDLEAAQKVADDLQETIDETEEELDLKSDELAQATEDLEGFWGKVGAMFGDDKGTADLTEDIGRLGADLEKAGNELVLAEEEKSDVQGDVIDSNEALQGMSEFFIEVQDSLSNNATDLLEPRK